MSLSAETLGSLDFFSATYNDPAVYSGGFVPAAEARGAVTVSVDKHGLGLGPINLLPARIVS